LPEQTAREEALQFVSDEPNIVELSAAYEETRADLSGFIGQQQKNFKTRFALWNGQSEDGRNWRRGKNNTDPVPFPGSSDKQVFVVDDLIRTEVALKMNALRKSSVVAMPVEGNDIRRAGIISLTLKWLKNQKVKNFYDEMEYCANNAGQNGIMVSQQFWRKREHRVLRRLSLNQFAQSSEENAAIAEKLVSGLEPDDLFIQRFQDMLDITKTKAREIITELAEDDESDIPIFITTENRPATRHLVIGEDVFFPAGTIDGDIQDVPYYFVREDHSPQTLREAIDSEGFDEEWVEKVIALDKSGNTSTSNSSAITISPASLVPKGQSATSGTSTTSEDDTIYIIRAYQRLTDEDNIMGVYETVFHPSIQDDTQGVQPYGKHELLNFPHGQFNIVVTKAEKYAKNLYETRSIAQKSKGTQDCIKVQIDSRINLASARTSPPLMHPITRPVENWGPGVRYGYRSSPDEVKYADVPNTDPVSVEIEKNLSDTEKAYYGHEVEGKDKRLANAKIQHSVNGFLAHAQKVLDQLLSLWQEFGPEEEWITVTGSADPVLFQRGNPGERFDFYLAFDTLMEDPEHAQKQLEALLKLAQFDTNGTISKERVIMLGVELLSPMFVDRVIEPKEQGTAKAMEEERQALAQISAGMDLDVPEDDLHELKLKVLQEYIQGSKDIPADDVQERLQKDEKFAERLEKRFKQRTFQIQQKENAQIGRLGAAPGNMGSA